MYFMMISNSQSSLIIFERPPPNNDENILHVYDKQKIVKHKLYFTEYIN